MIDVLDSASPLSFDAALTGSVSALVASWTAVGAAATIGAGFSVTGVFATCFGGGVAAELVVGSVEGGLGAASGGVCGASRLIFVGATGLVADSPAPNPSTTKSPAFRAASACAALTHALVPDWNIPADPSVTTLFP